MTENEYIEHIPEGCHFKTVQEHIDYLGLCWSIVHGRVTKEDHSTCKECELYEN